MTTAATIRKNTLAIALLIVSSVAVSVVTAQRAAAPHRQRAQELVKQGNWKEAYDQYSKLALSPATDPAQVGQDLTIAIQCLQHLGRSDEIDKFRENVIATHAKNWRLLQAAALTFLRGEHHGFIIAGEFHRGGHRGGGKMVSSLERDRVRSMRSEEHTSELQSQSK